MHPHEGPSPEQLDVFRRMTPEQRWRAAHRWYWTLRRHKAAFLHVQHPDWTDEQAEQAGLAVVAIQAASRADFAVVSLSSVLSAAAAVQGLRWLKRALEGR
jgi:hypothetical protein